MLRAGEALAAQIRSGDVLYRSGPAQFVVLLPEQGLDTANLAADAAARGGAGRRAAGDARSASAWSPPRPSRSRRRCWRSPRRRWRGRRQSGGIVGHDPAGGGALRLLVADDDPVSRLMIGAIVKREPGFELVGEAEDAGQAVELALRRRPDVVLLDVDMPGGGGARAAVEIREGLPEVRIVAISADDSQGSQYDMMRAGAVGFVTKGASDDEILRVIRSSARGDARGRMTASGATATPTRRAQRREVARDAHAPTVADLALAAAGGPGQATLLLAAVHDDRHAGIVFVIARELRIELVGERLRYDAVDHEADPSPLGGGKNSVMC